MKTSRIFSAHRSGFTLVEAVMVIVLTGILAAVVAVFMRTPIQGYIDAVRRAELTDAADTALRRIARDVRTALPNSVRGNTSQCFEFLPTLAGGRYRADNGSGVGPYDILDFTIADTAFDVLGQVGLPQPAGTQVVVYNLGIPGADAYAGSNRAAISGSTATSVNFSALKFPLQSPNRRFQVIPNSSTVFACIGATGVSASGDGLGALYRYAPPINPATVTCPATVPAGAVLLANNVNTCSFNYTFSAGSSAITQRAGLLTMTLQLTRANESAQLYQEVHVDNSP